MAKLTPEELASLKELQLEVEARQVEVVMAQSKMNRRAFEIDLKYELIGKRAQIDPVTGEITIQGEADDHTCSNEAKGSP